MNDLSTVDIAGNIDPVDDATTRSGNDFPRLLFVTPASFNHLTGGGVTFSNLFSGWPKDRLATAHTDPVPTSDDVCNRYFVLGPAEIDFHAPFRLARAVIKRDGKGGAIVERSSSPTRQAGFVACLQGDSIPQRVRMTTALERWISDFKPDLLYTIHGSNGFMDLAERIERRFDLPTVVHMMDDWPSIQYRRGLLAPLERWRMQRLLDRSISRAVLNMGIGTAMCRAFSARYGRPFVPFQNCVDIDRWRPLMRTDGTVDGRPFRLMYFGSIFANAQLASLRDVCVAVARLNAAGVSTRFDIVTPGFIADPFRAVLAVDPSIRLVEPSGDDRAFFASLAAADALILPVNFDPESVAFIRFSMPTKVPAYMASGTPILVYGPRGVAQVDYAAEVGWGEVVDENDAGKLCDGLQRILLEPGLRERLRLRAQHVAAANHDSARVRAAFQQALKSVVRSRS